ncbi:hypothetical protein D3C75_1041040 [compost metagenome]
MPLLVDRGLACKVLAQLQHALRQCLELPPDGAWRQAQIGLQGRQPLPAALTELLELGGPEVVQGTRYGRPWYTPQCPVHLAGRRGFFKGRVDPPAVGIGKGQSIANVGIE